MNTTTTKPHAKLITLFGENSDSNAITQKKQGIAITQAILVSIMVFQQLQQALPQQQESRQQPVNQPLHLNGLRQPPSTALQIITQIYQARETAQI